YKERLGDRVGQDSRRIFKSEKEGETAPVLNTFQTGKGQRSKEIVTYRNGQEGPVIVHTAPIRGKDGNVELVVEISADITEIKRLQEELRSTRQRHQQLFNAVPCYITVQDREFRLSAANHQFKEHFEYEPGAYCYKVYKHRDEPCDDCPVAKTFETGQSHQSEMEVVSRHGEKYNVLIQTAPIRDAAGEVTQVMEMSTNITQIRQLEDHLSSLGLMVSTISHGIKGVLTGLDAGVFFLDSGLEKGNQERLQEGLDVVKHMAERIRNVVMNILYYAKGRELNWERIEVLPLLQETVGIVAPKINDKPIRLDADFQEDPGHMEADPVLVRAALINILENAVEACMEDASKPDHGILFAARREADHILIDITDDGPGMSPETREKLFTLFFSSKGHKGTGLGLFIAHKVINQHGGEIEVDSTPGAGAHFHIRIPTTLPDAAKAPIPENE
ncbi:MAG: PAS domain-containing protein, partial [Desulfobacterales bacterium]|nr:PAS domain-containing protein [Desulfobacterales bacterium]